ncbi:MAG: hypothetical protein OXC62_09210 [Aestuariivita sp.]|nr:hypothetical protein [Aestuariivita sp.]
MPKTGLFKKAEQAFLKKVTFSEKRLPQITEKKDSAYRTDMACNHMNQIRNKFFSMCAAIRTAEEATCAEQWLNSNRIQNLMIDLDVLVRYSPDWGYANTGKCPELEQMKDDLTSEKDYHGF